MACPYLDMHQESWCPLVCGRPQLANRARLYLDSPGPHAPRTQQAMSTASDGNHTRTRIQLGHA